MLRIKPLWRLHCCALAVCGFGKGRREAVIGVDVDAEGGGAARLTDIEHVLGIYVPALGLIQWFLQTSSLEEAKRMDQAMRGGHRWCHRLTFSRTKFGFASSRTRQGHS